MNKQLFGGDMKKCAYCGKPIINGHVVAKIDWKEYEFCDGKLVDGKRIIGMETCVDRFLVQHPIKYRFHSINRVQ
ncbi:hypothetical protein HYT04_00005 [Candidatus Kaiserbacteria bacterium]|nr:hypothetical protein [Candidatus Kaiserbacteria bacterium]